MESSNACSRMFKGSNPFRANHTYCSSSRTIEPYLDTSLPFTLMCGHLNNVIVSCALCEFQMVRMWLQKQTADSAPNVLSLEKGIGQAGSIYWHNSHKTAVSNSWNFLNCLPFRQMPSRMSNTYCGQGKKLHPDTNTAELHRDDKVTHNYKCVFWTFSLIFLNILFIPPIRFILLRLRMNC